MSKLWHGLVMAVIFTLVTVTVGRATTTLTGSPYDGEDGVADCTPSTSVFPSGTGTCTVGSGGPTVNWKGDVPSGGNDNAFGQGTKDDNTTPTIVLGSIPPNKNDLTTFGTSAAAAQVSGQQHVFLYLAWTRAVNTGSADLSFEYNQAATPALAGPPGTITLNRTAGDLLIFYDFGGSGAPTLTISKWITSGGKGNCAASSSAVPPCWASTNPLNNGTTSEGKVSGSGLFGEAVVDLTGANIIPAGTCEVFNQSWVKARSSPSFSELKDFIAPITAPLTTCVQPTLATQLSSGSATGTTLAVQPGASVTDQATITTTLGSPASGDTLTYNLYTAASGCTGTPAATSGPLAVSSFSTLPSWPFTAPSTIGGYNIQVVFTPSAADTQNKAATSTCTDEVLTVFNPATQLAITDQLVGLPTGAQGTVTYTVFTTCSGGVGGGTQTDVTPSPNTVSGTTGPVSKSFSLSTGSAYFVAAFTGTGGSTPTGTSFTSVCTKESATIG